jgi:hypothetical protein
MRDILADINVLKQRRALLSQTACLSSRSLMPIACSKIASTPKRSPNRSSTF